MKKLLILFFVLGFASLQAQSKWAVDPGHSNVGFEITHMMISTTEGEFKTFSIDLASDSPKNFDGAEISASIEVNSVTTDNEKRDGHLLTADFFDAENYPNITFKNAKLKKESDSKYSITGELTLLKTTKEVTFDAKLVGVGDDPWGNTRSGWKATTTIDRTEYGMEGSTGMVGTDVDLILNIEMILQK